MPIGLAVPLIADMSTAHIAIAFRQAPLAGAIRVPPCDPHAVQNCRSISP